MIDQIGRPRLTRNVSGGGLKWSGYRAAEDLAGAALILPDLLFGSVDCRGLWLVGELARLWIARWARRPGSLLGQLKK